MPETIPRFRVGPRRNGDRSLKCGRQPSSDLFVMSAQTEAIVGLVDEHDSVLAAWATRRSKTEKEVELDSNMLKTAARGYILWFAALSDALLLVLQQRSWNSIGSLLEKCITDGIAGACKNPVNPFGVPTLLATDFSLNIMLAQINTGLAKITAGKTAQLFPADVANGLSFGEFLVDTDKAQQLYDEMRETFGILAASVAGDLRGGSANLNVDQPTVPPLDLFRARSLDGKSLQRRGDPRRIQLVSDYSGGSALSQVTQTLTLKTDGRFKLEEKIFEAVVGVLAHENERYINGNWQIVLQDGAPYLQLQAGGQILISWKSETAPAGFHYLAGNRWQFVTR